ncbi:MAG: hypothetical protein V4721_03970 [Bacteroidota bacterium]
MSTHADKSQDNRSQSVSNSESLAKGNSESALLVEDYRPEATAQRKLQEMANNSPQVTQMKSLQEMANNSPQITQQKALQQMASSSVAPIQMKGENWGKLSGKVVGNRKKIGMELHKAGTDESVYDDAMSETMRKRLSGGDWEDTNSYETAQENGKVVKKAAVDADGKKVESRHQLSADEKAGLKKYKGTEGLSEAYQKMAKEQLKKFSKSHAFISEWAFGNILNVWKNWGSDANFVSPLSEAEVFFQQAVDGDGIATLEKALGIGPGGWSNKGQTSTIYRFIVNDPDKFQIRLPSGAEGQAYQKEWLSGGKTLGGGSEAVIKNMTLAQLRESVSSGGIEIHKITFLGKGSVEQTKVSAI